MKNRLLSIIRKSIPYLKELRLIAGSVTSTILMQQLDYWFEKYPNGFYKFLEPAQRHKHYKQGDSWIEELGFSPDEFRCAFKNIGKRYKSKTAYLQSQDPFDGKYYCSYHDKASGLTWYFRNHTLVDADLEHLCASENNGYQQTNSPVNGQSPVTVNRQSPFLEMDNPEFYKLGISSSRNGQSPVTLYTEITAENTTDISPLTPQTENQQPSQTNKEREKISVSNSTQESKPTIKAKPPTKTKLTPDQKNSVMAKNSVAREADYKLNKKSTLLELPWENQNSRNQFDPRLEKWVKRQFRTYDRYRDAEPEFLMVEVRGYISTARHDPKVRDKLFIAWDAVNSAQGAVVDNTPKPSTETETYVALDRDTLSKLKNLVISNAGK